VRQLTSTRRPVASRSFQKSRWKLRAEMTPLNVASISRPGWVSAGGSRVAAELAAPRATLASPGLDLPRSLLGLPSDRGQGLGLLPTVAVGLLAVLLEGPQCVLLTSLSGLALHLALLVAQIHDPVLQLFGLLVLPGLRLALLRAGRGHRGVL